MINMESINTKIAKTLETLYIYIYIDTLFIRREACLTWKLDNKINNLANIRTCDLYAFSM